VFIFQCLVEDPSAGADGQRCTSTRGRTAVVQEGPETQLSFTAFHDILVNRATTGGYSPEWTACEPCVLVVEIGAREDPLGVFPMAMEPTDSPIRPTIALDPAGPIAPGSTVTVRATGLQPGTRQAVGWCPATRAQGGGDPPCVFPDGSDASADLGSGPLVADDGTLVVRDLLVPPAGASVHGEACSIVGRCGIGIDAGDAFSVVAFAPLDLTG
jgi:hypothetical protein